MHLNYHLLRRLVPELSKALTGGSLVEAFSQDKDELIMAFLDVHNEAFYLRATLTSRFSCLSFLEDFHRSRRNSVNLFQELQQLRVTGLRLFNNERAFAIGFERDYQLVFKLHGNRSNIILFHKEDRPVLFKNGLKGDLGLKYEALDRPISRNLELYLQNPDYKLFYPTFGKVVGKYFEESGFYEQSPERQWQSLSELVKQMDNSPIYLAKEGHKPVLALVPLKEAESLGTQAIDALNRFYQAYAREYFLEEKKARLERQLQQQLKKTERYLEKTETKLKGLEEGLKPSQIADIIMANLHQIPAQQKKVKLLDFYHDQEIEIKLNTQLSPQKNAEQYYRKGKHRKIEVEKLEESIDAKFELLESLTTLLDELSGIQDHKALKQFIKANSLEQNTKQEVQQLPYKAFEYEGFQIWVGRNAKANDELSLKHAYKNDLWLHAKDVPGSHVIIKQQSGKSIPAKVLERAAELAAWYSKRKTDTLVPVIYTEAKYIRKPKGSPSGAVIVSKEKVVMVPPKGPTD